MHSPRDRQGQLIIGGVVVVLVGLMALRAVLVDPVERGPDMCGPTPPASTVIILDRSDAVSAQTLAEIRARALAYIRDSTEVEERVSVFSISRISPDSLEPEISRCRPPRRGNRLFQNVAVIKKQFTESFEQPLTRAIEEAGISSDQSPIAGALIDLSESRQYLGTARNTLLVFSDMMEHTPRFSLYGCRAPGSVVPAFRASRSGAPERPTFKNTLVSLHLVPRIGLDATTLRCRDALWLWFFGDNGGQHAGLDVANLPGGTAVQAGSTVRGRGAP